MYRGDPGGVLLAHALGARRLLQLRPRTHLQQAVQLRQQVGRKVNEVADVVWLREVGLQVLRAARLNARESACVSQRTRVGARESPLVPHASQRDG